jgi:hypothetical protein
MRLGSTSTNIPDAKASAKRGTPLEVPLTHVVGAESVRAETGEPGRGFFSLGGWLPGGITAGSTHRHGGPVFWNVSDLACAIAISLRDERYSQLIVDVADRDEVTAAIRKEIAGQALSAA